MKMCIATPMYGGQCHGVFMTSIMGLKNVIEAKGWGFMFIYTDNESLITRARNKLVEIFLKSDATHLWFIDADMGFDPWIMSTLPEYNVDVICGLCPKKQIRWQEVKNVVLQNPNIDPFVIPRVISNSDNNVNYFYSNDSDISGLVRVRHAGTGCMLIKRDVITKLDAVLPKHIDYGSDGTASPIHKSLFFDTKVSEESGLYLSEDYYFCEQWRNIGGTIYMAHNVKLSHTGIYTYY